MFWAKTIGNYTITLELNERHLLAFDIREWPIRLPSFAPDDIGILHSESIAGLSGKEIEKRMRELADRYEEVNLVMKRVDGELHGWIECWGALR